MELRDLQNEALKLPATERARLAEALLESLETLSDDENRSVWAEEAIRRDREFDEAAGNARPSGDVFRDARARLG